MNREIKFRAWDNVDKMMYVNLQNGIHFEDGSVYAFQDFIDNKGYHEFNLMQFTGLQDKNGKDIYEGDLISEEGSKPYEVVWQYHSVQWIMQYTGEGRTYRHMAYDYAQQQYEVIGNIYENPELLKQ